MRLYFKKYEESAKRSSELLSTSHQARFYQGSPVLGKRKLDKVFARCKTRRRAYLEAKSKLDIYLDEQFDCSSENFDILLWWKTNAEKYPLVQIRSSHMAESAHRTWLTKPSLCMSVR
jgi:hypothetical protein